MVDLRHLFEQSVAAGPYRAKIVAAAVGYVRCDGSGAGHRVARTGQQPNEGPSGGGGGDDGGGCDDVARIVARADAGIRQNSCN